MTASDNTVVETRHGKLRGGVNKGVHFFKGVHYADTTAGANRFMPPQPVKPWAGVRDALDYGQVVPQGGDSTSMIEWKRWMYGAQPKGEDSLVLNVWTPAVNDNRKRPVMFFLHGGGFNTGSGAGTGYDGTYLARRGDVVVITINHRLNCFGHTYLGHLDASGRFADAGNTGIMDMVAGLRWVNENIAAFGGDAGNVTVFGQSGGGSKVGLLMTMPSAKGLFRRGIVQSASSLIRMAVPEAAARSTDALLKVLDIAPKDFAKLQDVPMERLIKARDEAVAANGDVDDFRPVVDGRSLTMHPFDPVASGIGADLPMMIGTCENEVSSLLAKEPKSFALTMEEARGRVARFMSISESDAAHLLADYAKRRPGMPPSQVMILIFSDHMYRRNDMLAAERKAALGRAPAYMYLFTWKTPVLGGILGSPHTLCLPFVFGTLDEVSLMIGKGPEQQALMERVQDAWLAFARTGNPNHPGIPEWKPYNGDTRPTMLFNDTCTLVNDPAKEDRLAIGVHPLYSTDASAKRNDSNDGGGDRKAA